MTWIYGGHFLKNNEVNLSRKIKDRICAANETCAWKTCSGHHHFFSGDIGAIGKFLVDDTGRFFVIL